MKNSRSKKNLQKLASNGEEAEETTTGSNGQSSCSSITEDDNASMENSVGATSIGKTRASRGSATDPQSLYARVISPYMLFIICFLRVKINLQ